MNWLAPIAAFCCFFIYAIGVVPAGINDLVLTDARLIAEVPSLQSNDPPRVAGPYLRLTLSTARNVIAMARGSELNIYPMIVDCADRNLAFFAYGPYRRGLHTAYYTDRAHPRFESLRHEQAAAYEYELLMPVTGRLLYEPDGNRSMPAYDLRREHRALCVRVGGGNMLGGHFRSNEVRLDVPAQ